ncbi:C-C motif chemokine 4-like [Discoglossus pictus]
MKVSMVALSLLLSVCCSLVHSSPMFGSAPTSCCFTYTSRRIAQAFVIDYYRTSSLCGNPGIIFSTKKGRTVCANPSDKWVQDYIIRLDKKANSA